MLAIWLDTAPNCEKDQRDPDGWTTGAEQTPYLAERLAELANAPDVAITWMLGDAAEIWSRIEQGRRRAVSKVERTKAREAILGFDFPEHIEAEGLRAGRERIASSGRKVPR